MKILSAPQELKDLPQWVCWDANKVPITPKTGKNASSVDPSTWGTFDEACELYTKNGKCEGVGFVFTRSDPYVGIDLDDCFDGAALKPEAQKIVTALNSYTERSPSGKGLHIIVKASLSESSKRNGVEVYPHSRYFTVTGDLWEMNFDVEERQQQITELVKQLGGTTRQQMAEIEITDSIEPGMRNDWLFHQARTYFHAGKTIDEAGVVIRLLNKSCTPPLPEREVMTLLSSAYNHQEVKEGAESFMEHSGNSPPTDPLFFPERLITGTAGDFAKIYAEYLETPIHFLWFSYLTCFGNLLAGRVTLESELAPSPRLYTILLGESADDRKSTAITKAINFFRSTVEGYPMVWGVGSAEGLLRVMKDHRSMLLALDEFKQFVGKCKIDASILLPCVNSLFENTWYEGNTAKAAVKLDNAQLSLLAASTIETYEKIWERAFLDIGLPNRLFLVPGRGERRFGIPQVIPPHPELHRNLLDALNLAISQKRYSIEKEAYDLYQEWYLGLKPSPHTKRLDTYALRLMVLLTANNRDVEVVVPVVRDVIDIMNWQHQVRIAFDPIDADSKMARMEESIRRVLKRRGIMSALDLKRYVNAHRAGLWLYKTALQNLKGCGEVIQNQKGLGLASVVNSVVA